MYHGTDTHREYLLTHRYFNWYYETSQNFIGALLLFSDTETIVVLSRTARPLGVFSYGASAVDKDVPYFLNVNINYYSNFYLCAYLFTF